MIQDMGEHRPDGTFGKDACMEMSDNTERTDRERNRDYAI